MTATVLLSVFAYSLLCAIVPTCDNVLDPPESSIRQEFYTRRRTDSGEPILVNPYPVVFTRNGAVQGYSMGTVGGNRIYAFEGIRFGLSTGGQRRFRPPVPAKPWSGVYTAHKPGPPCMQIHPLFLIRVIGSEDCLFLNIYVPDNLPLNEVDKKFRNAANSTHPKIPVIVYFHGGSFIFGEGKEYGPAYLVDRNIILITVNYRLGPLGFLSTADSASPGNYGLKDQALALKFIHENIEKFGGDRNRVTLMGQSAGATSVHLHMVANKTRQYFNAGISLSASGFHHWGLYTDNSYALYWTNWLAEVANCPRLEKATSYELVDCMRKVNGAFLVSYSARIFKWLLFPPVIFAPVVEEDGPDAFLTDTVENIYRRGEVAKYPWIGSLTAEEGYTAIFVIGLFQQTKYFRQHFNELQSITLSYDRFFNKSNATELEIMNYKIRSFYFEDESVQTVPISKIAQIFSDRYFISGQVKAIKSHAQWAPTYAYIFSYAEHRNNVGKLFGLKQGEWGVGHTEDAFYFFNSTRFYDGFQKNEKAYKLSQIMVNCIGNFAHKRIPYYTNEKGQDLSIWKPVVPYEEPKFLEFDTNIRMISNPFVRNIKFWESLELPDTTPAEVYIKKKKV